MRLDRSQEWWLAKADREGDASVGAGALGAQALFELPPKPAPAPPSAADETRIAFGRFVNLMRRRRGLSIEQLAAAAQLEARELLIIEDDMHHVPESRTVYQLSRMFEVSQRRLMELAGLAVANDAGFREEAVRFAARSESVQKLSREERSALEAFVAVLSEHEPKR